MAIKRLEKVKCSLNLGYVYNVNYSFAPQEGVRITLFFIKENGSYNKNILSPKNKTRIEIGSAAFNMYPISWENAQSGTQKTFKVDFIDDTFRLKNYYIALTGKGCGEGVFQLGRVVDTRTQGEKDREDPDLFKIKKFTQDSDLEYSFSEFLVVLRKVFPVKATVSIDSTITRPFEGTFEDVLGAWCSYFNYSYFFENGSLIIFDPTTLNITFPAIPADAIESSESESIENTYDKTVWNNFYQDGGEINVGSVEGDAESNLFIANETLYPWENVLDIKTLNNNIYGPIDVNQLVAAQYGKEFWFIYNYQKGTAQEICGYEDYVTSPNLFNLSDIASRFNLIQNSLGTDKNIAFFDQDKFERNFNFYYQYGRTVAGRYYISNNRLDLGSFSLYQWYDQNEIQSLTIENLKQQQRLDPGVFFRSPGSSYGFVEESESEFFKGLALNGTRIYYIDKVDRDYETNFALTDEQKQIINAVFKNLTGGDFGSGSYQWSDGSSRDYVIYGSVDLLQILELINSIETKKEFFNYRYENFFMKGFFSAEISNQEEENNELFNDTDIQIGVGPQVVSNTSVLKAEKDSDYVAYYSKYNSCNSESTKEGMLNRRFESINPSVDVPIPITITKTSKGVISIQRNLNYVNQYKNSGILKKLAIPFKISEKRKSFTLNYFYDGIPTSFISNGLVGLSINISESGLTASYSYSNEMLRVPPSTQLIEKLERAMKSSWVRQYNPNRTATV